MALGMTATILARDLAHHGHQALDLGHVDIEYMWMQMGATEKVPVPGKFTNEADTASIAQECHAPEYLSQIVARVGI